MNQKVMVSFSAVVKNIFVLIPPFRATVSPLKEGAEVDL
jgi:hypothetical protein